MLEPTIYRTRGERANHYTTDEPTIYRTRGERANHYTTDEPTIYSTRGERANHYTTDAVQILIKFHSILSYVLMDSKCNTVLWNIFEIWISLLLWCLYNKDTEDKNVWNTCMSIHSKNNFFTFLFYFQEKLMSFIDMFTW